MSAPTVSFNGSDLASTVSGLRILSTDPYRSPNRELAIGRIANTDKSITSAAYFKDKKINVVVEIAQTTRELFEAALDQLNAIIQTREAAMIFNYGSSTRKWTATLANIGVTNLYGGRGELDLEFQCSDPMGYDTATTTLFSVSRSGSTSNETFVVGGTALWQQPTLTLTLSALTGGTTKSVTIGNPSTGQAVVITRTWVAADVLVIDCAAKTVKVNGTEVAFTGAIPEWAPGAGSIDYTDTLTTRTRAFSGVYYKRYM